MDELDFYDDEEVGLALAEAPKRRRRKRKRNPEPATIGLPILLALAGYLGWVVYNQTKFKVWNFQPWQLAGLRKPRLRLRQNNAQAEEERRRASFHRAVEESLKPTVYTVKEVDVWRKPVTRDSEREIVSFITP